MACQWCGDKHGVDQLCAKAQRGMTRRSFCFLFGAGIAGAALAGAQASEFIAVGEIRRITSADLAQGDKVVACGYYTKLTRDCTIEELTAYFGGFYGYQHFTGYPVFDTPKRVNSGWASWVHDTLPTREEALAQ